MTLRRSGQEEEQQYENLDTCNETLMRNLEGTLIGRMLLKLKLNQN